MSPTKTVGTVIYSLEVETLSPLFIGSQDTLELSPYTDYYVDGGHVYYVDQKKLIQAAEQQQKLEAYLEIVSEFDNNRAKESVGTFIRKQLGGGDFSAYRQRQFGLGPDLRLPIAPTVSSTGQAFVPGSSLKGALRTAILYHWLTSEAGSKVLKQSFRQIERLQATNRRKAQLRRNDYHGQREVRREENRILRSILPEEELFGSITNSDARRIRVRDCTPVRQEQVGVYLAQRHRIVPHRGKYQRRQDSSIPQPRQAIMPGTTFAGEINLLTDFQNPALHYLTNNEAFVKGVNKFALDSIDNELYQLDMAKSEGGEYRQRAERLMEFYEKELPLKEDEKDTILLRLGGGKTVFDNSLLLALVYGDPKQKEEERYFRILREALFGTREDHDLFPVTRTLGPEGEVFGWVKVKVK